MRFVDVAQWYITGRIENYKIKYISISLSPDLGFTIVSFFKYFIQEADINFLPVPKTLSRSHVVDQTFPVLTDNLAIMIPYPETESSVSLTISPAFSIVSLQIKRILTIFYLLRYIPFDCWDGIKTILHSGYNIIFSDNSCSRRPHLAYASFKNRRKIYWW